jgi:hypothetical protein
MLALSMQKDWVHSKTLKILSSLLFPIFKIFKLPHKLDTVQKNCLENFEINTKINYMRNKEFQKKKQLIWSSYDFPREFLS